MDISGPASRHANKIGFDTTRTVLAKLIEVLRLDLRRHT